MVLVARYCQQEAMERMKPVSAGLSVSRPLERVETDECKINLLTIMAQSGLLGLFTREELEELGLDNKKDRWWLVFAIDGRTRMILGMQLTKNPTTSAAPECLRMTMSSKGEFADAVGALTPWTASGKCETLVADNGVFKSARFTDSCANLGINVLRTIAGSPALRGMIERLFGTAAMKLFARLSGRTFSNVLERGDHPAEERACLATEDLCFALVRWIVDIYHNTPHEALGGRTPLQQWQEDRKNETTPFMHFPPGNNGVLVLDCRSPALFKKTASPFWACATNPTILRAGTWPTGTTRSISVGITRISGRSRCISVAVGMRSAPSMNTIAITGPSMA